MTRTQDHHLIMILSSDLLFKEDIQLRISEQQNNSIAELLSILINMEETTSIVGGILPSLFFMLDFFCNNTIKG